MQRNKGTIPLPSYDFLKPFLATGVSNRHIYHQENYRISAFSISFAHAKVVVWKSQNSYSWLLLGLQACSAYYFEKQQFQKNIHPQIQCGFRMIKWETFGKNLSFFHFQRSGFGRPFTAVKTHSAWARHFSLFLDAGFSTDGRRMKNKPRPAVLLFTHNKCMWHVSEGLRLGTGSRSLCWFCPRGTFVSWTSSHSSSVLPTE